MTRRMAGTRLGKKAEHHGIVQMVLCGLLCENLSKMSSFRFPAQGTLADLSIETASRLILLCTRRRAIVPGCGRGYDAAYFARLGLETWGVDISPTAVDAAKIVCNHHSNTVTYLLTSFCCVSVRSCHARSTRQCLFQGTRLLQLRASTREVSASIRLYFPVRPSSEDA